MPQHLKVCDTHLLLHRRPSNNKHFEQLRSMFPLSLREVNGGRKGLVTQTKYQQEITTPEGYWMLWIPSTLRRDIVEATVGSSA